MAKPGKSGFKKVLKLIVDSVEGQLSQMPSEEADVKRKKIRRIAAATVSRGLAKASKAERTRARRVSPGFRPKVS